ncbi:MAG: PAS domain-containing protein [Anaerolineales bacterium]|nr:PAS domain-containing protein [Anaerolineales bacterium]
MLPDFRVRQRDYLLEIARALTQELDMDKLLKRILRLSADLLAGQAGLIVLKDRNQGWHIATSHGIPPTLLNYLHPLLSKVDDEKMTSEEELNEVNRILQTVARRASLGLLSGVGLPLNARDQILGVIFIFRNYAGPFSTNDRNLLQSFADQAAIAVSNAELYSQVDEEGQRMSALLDAVADGIMIMTPGHRIQRVNPAFCRVVGKPENDIEGKLHEEIIQWAKVEHGMTLEQAETGGWPLSSTTSLYVEGDLIRDDSSGLPVGITYAPLFSNDGKLLNLIGSIRDISHFRQAEELKSTFISVISHELKTPVALIKGYVGTLRRDDVDWDSDIVDDSLEVIEEEADRLSELIENLLDASRLEAGVLAINASDLSLPVLAERSAVRFRTQTDKHQFVVDFPEDFPVILADEKRIAQVFYNLISNAIKYSPSGGKITIRGFIRQHSVHVCVVDEGSGIAPGDIPHIFDRFYRAEAAQRKTKGVGLGLYLTRAIIEAHKGSIWVDTCETKGACICFSLPRPT